MPARWQLSVWRPYAPGTHRGRVPVIEAKLYSRPSQPIPLFGAPVTEATTRLVGGWADDPLTTGGDIGMVRKVG